MERDYSARSPIVLALMLGQADYHLTKPWALEHDLYREISGSDPAWWPPGRVPFPLETSVPGVFAAGDVRYRSIKRVASAAGDGATAVRLTHEYLSAEEPAVSPWDLHTDCAASPHQPGY